MNIHMPFTLRVVYPAPQGSSTVILKGYELMLINLNEQVRTGELDSFHLSKVPDVFFKMNFFSGFYLDKQEDRTIRAVDLRVNEGMLFSGATVEEVKATIESYLHGLAYEEQADRDRKAIQALREKNRGAS